MRPYSLANRLVMGAALWSGLALIIGGLTLASIFRSAVERQFDDRLIVILESLVAESEVGEAGGVSVPASLGDIRFEQSFSGWYWQIALVENPSGSKNTIKLARSRSLWDQSLKIPENVTTMEYLRAHAPGPEKQDLRLIARTIGLPGAFSPVTIVVAADRREVENEISRFNAILFWAFVALGSGLLIAVLIQVRVGLAPLREVRRALAAVRTGDADRLDGDFPSEITPLAKEMNALITHNAEVLERSRTQVGNLAHALKTPLTILGNETKSHPGDLAKTVDRQTRIMREHVDHYLARARAAATARLIGARTEVELVSQRLAHTLERLYQDRGIHIDVEITPNLCFRGERQDLEEVLGNLLDNACKWAKSKVHIKAMPIDQMPAQRDADQAKSIAPIFMKLIIEDDGEGLSEEERQTVLARGARLDETAPGSGLGLSIVADIADLYGGSFSLNQSPLGGVRAILTLPLAQPRSTSLG